MHWKERLDLFADAIAFISAALGIIRLFRTPEIRDKIRDVVESRVHSHRFYGALNRYLALRDAEDLYNSAPERFGRMAIWMGLGIFGLLSGLLARTSHATGHPAEVVSGVLLLICLIACGVAIADALTTGYKLFNYENYRRKAIEKIRKVAPELVDDMAPQPHHLQAVTPMSTRGEYA